jgi:chaperonin GroES
MAHGGDRLARGAASAQFEPANVSEEKWLAIFGEEGVRKLNAMDEKDRQKLMEEAQAKVAEIEKAEEANKPTSTSIRAVQDRIWVIRLEEEEKVGTFYVPDESKEKPAKGIVRAVGPGKWVNGNLQKVGINIGDKVVFGKYSGAEVQVGFIHYLVLREEDVFGIEVEGEDAS